MRIYGVTPRYIILVIIFTLAAFYGAAEAQEAAPLKNAAPEGPGTAPALTISDLISFSTTLSGRLSALQRNLQIGFGLSGFEKILGETEEALKAQSASFKEMKSDSRLGFERLAEVKMETMALVRQLHKSWKPLSHRIQQLESWQREWSMDKKRLLAFEAALTKDESSKTPKPAIARANETIDQAAGLIAGELKILLALENRAAGIQAPADALVAEIESLLQSMRGDLYRRSAPLMFSSEFVGQFNMAIRGDWEKGFGFGYGPQWRAIQRNAHVIVFQVGLWLVFAVIILRNRAALATEPHLDFIARRPLSAGVLIGFVVFFPFYETGSGLWRLIDIAMVFFCTARLSGGLIAGSWRRRSVYVFVLVLVIISYLQVIEFPRPLLRLFILVVSSAGLFLCVWRVRLLPPGAETRRYRWALWGGILVYGITVVANVIGYAALAAHLLDALLNTILLFIMGWVLMAGGRGGIKLVSKSTTIARFDLLQKNAPAVVRVASRLLDCFVIAFVATYLLVTWGVYASGLEAFQSIMEMGFSIGSWQVDVGIVLAAALCLYGAHLISGAVQGILTGAVFPKRGVERGVQLSMARLVHYAILLAGFLLALTTLGVNFTNITIIGGALGVGIGFGLQTIVNNFVSGLILLFERPVRVGDCIEVGGTFAEIRKIGLRATVVETFDRADLVIPNSDLISNQVTNWTRSNRMIRIRIPVGVAYGSDLQLVTQILLECAQDNPMVVSLPASKALFMGFGDSSLDFELRVFTPDIDEKLVLRSELLLEIDEQFRSHGIEIPFPQRDLHLRSADESVILQPKKTAG